MNGPVRLVYVEEVEDHSAALKREIEIKQYNHERKANLAKRESLAQGFNTETSEKE
jgi:predicted GIY-YIG superfamily endonuclease